MIDTHTIKQNAANRWPEILSRLGGVDPELLDGKHHPCPKCGGADRFRMIDADVGALFCNACFNKSNGDGLAAIMWLTGDTFPAATDRVAEYLGISRNGNGQPVQIDPVEAVARLKNCSVDGLKIYGAESRGGKVVLPVYDEDGNQCSTFTLDPKGGKGLLAKDKPSGLFLPEGRLPAAGERWALVEGVKDASVLYSEFDLPTVGTNGTAINAKFAQIFAGVDLLIVPDRDTAGRDGAMKSAALLYGVAASIKQAVLPLPFQDTKGGDVRDVLKVKGGREMMEKAIAGARPVPSGNTTAVKPAKSEVLSPVTAPWEPFPTECLPEPARSAVREGAAALGCDETLIALPMLAGLAGSIGATRRITLKAGWQEPAVLWLATVAESGAMKSPGQDCALRPLMELQAWALAEYPELLRQFERDKALFEADFTAWKRKGRNADEPPPEKPDEPQVRRYIVDDITVEALADRLQHTPRGVLLACDELAGWLGSFDAYKSSRSSDVAKWLPIHRAQQLLVDRKSGAIKTVFVKRAAVSIIGGIQPGAIRRALGTEHLENGLAARLLLAAPPRPSKRWTEDTVSEQLLRRMEVLFGRLLALDFGVDANECAAPIDLPLTPEGKAAWITFYNDHARGLATATGIRAAVLSKLEGAAARLALIVHLVESVTDPVVNADAVDQTSVEAGATMARWFAREAVRVYGLLKETEEAEEDRHLVELISRNGGEITTRELMHASREYRGDAGQAEAALTRLIELGFGSWVTTPPGDQGGRPGTVFRLSGVVSGNTTPINPEKHGSCVTTPHKEHRT